MAGELVLIVEDDEWNRKLERDLLQFLGCRTIEAETGEDGVAQATTHRPDLILMDYLLPGIDGVETFRRIRDTPATAHIPILAISASAMPEQARRMREAGFDGFQSKPINVAEFMQAVSEMLATKENRR